VTGGSDREIGRQRAESREQRAESREQRAESREQRAESREQRVSSIVFFRQGLRTNTELTHRGERT
jgi:hypothetical protein